MACLPATVTRTFSGKVKEGPNPPPGSACLQCSAALLHLALCNPAPRPWNLGWEATLPDFNWLWFATKLSWLSGTLPSDRLKTLSCCEVLPLLWFKSILDDSCGFCQFLRELNIYCPITEFLMLDTRGVVCTPPLGGQLKCSWSLLILILQRGSISVVSEMSNVYNLLECSSEKRTWRGNKVCYKKKSLAWMQEGRQNSSKVDLVYLETDLPRKLASNNYPYHSSFFMASSQH